MIDKMLNILNMPVRVREYVYVCICECSDHACAKWRVERSFLYKRNDLDDARLKMTSWILSGIKSG